MKNIPEEIIYAIFQIIDFKTLKQCHLVCWEWCRIATEFLFRRFAYHEENSTSFKEILRVGLSRFLRVISIGKEGPNTVDDSILLILRDSTLLHLVAQPTVGVIRQRHRNEFITTLTGMDFQHIGLPVLESIRFITNEPYSLIDLTRQLRKLHIDTETIQFQILAWPSLVDLHLRGNINLDRLEKFLFHHEHIRKLHLATVRPLGPAPDFHQRLKNILDSQLEPELAGSIMRHAANNADGHERSLLREIHAQLDDLVDKETAKKMNQLVVTEFEILLNLELGRYATKIGKMRIPFKCWLEMGCSIGYFWEDELAIKGIRLPGDDTSKPWVWTNDEIKESVGNPLISTRLWF